MPMLEANGARIHYEERGDGEETIVFAHGLLWSGEMFEAQVAALSKRYRCITFDFRGQGQSGVTASGYDMDTLAGDALALIEARSAAPCHLAGLSMGGFVAMRVASRRPELVRSLILMETSADPEPDDNQRRYRMLSLVARWLSLGLVAKPVMKIMFGHTFLEDAARVAEREAWRARLVANHRIGITRAVGGVITREGVYDEIGSIRVPTLVIVGEEDVATPREKAERIHGRIPGSELVTIPHAGHTSTVENPEAVTAAIEAFLSKARGGAGA